MAKSNDDSKKSLAWTVLSIGVALMTTAIFLLIQLVDVRWIQIIVSWIAALVFFYLGWKVMRFALSLLHQTKPTKR